MGSTIQFESRTWLLRFENHAGRVCLPKSQKVGEMDEKGLWHGLALSGGCFLNPALPLPPLFGEHMHPLANSIKKKKETL